MKDMDQLIAERTEQAQHERQHAAELECQREGHKPIVSRSSDKVLCSRCGAFAVWPA